VIGIVAVAVLITVASTLSVAAICGCAIGMIIVILSGLFFTVCYIALRVSIDWEKQFAKVRWYCNEHIRLAILFSKEVSELQLECEEKREKENLILQEKYEELLKKRRALGIPRYNSGVYQEKFIDGEEEELAHKICDLYEMYNSESQRITKLYPKEHQFRAELIEKLHNNCKEIYRIFSRKIEEKEDYLSSFQV
jgi:hypothetical protein